MTKRRPLWALAALALAALLLLSGCAPTEDAPPFPDDGPAPPVSRTAAFSFLRKAMSAAQGATETKTLSITVTDAEVTSFLNIRRELTQELGNMGVGQLGQLEGFDDMLPEGDLPEGVDIETLRRLLGTDEGPGEGLLRRLRPGLREPAVYFRANGQIIARGHLAFLRWRVPIRVVLAPKTSDGELVFDFVEGQVDRFKMPEIVFDLIGKGVAEALMLGQEYAEITQIQVSGGTFTLSGRYNQ
jgi:hypothetical protein